MLKKVFVCLFLTAFFSCDTTKPVLVYMEQESQVSDDNFESLYDGNNISWGTLDTLSGDIPIDTLGPILRKIIYRDLSAVKIPINFSGTVVFKVCVNRSGLVTYAEVLQDGSTIKDKNTLKTYLKAATGYKYTADPTAPNQQCGKLKFTIDNSLNNKLR